MLEEQGKTGLIDLIKKAFRFLAKHTINLGRDAERELIKNIEQTGKKSVKSLVKTGADLEISEEIKNKDHLKIICNQCKKQGIVFGIKKTAEGYKMVYQRKHSAILSDVIKNTIAKEITQQKPKLSEVFDKIGQIQQKNIVLKTPVKHREVGVR
jgi:hypothetical protein